jgi:two-component system response regulator NreC
VTKATADTELVTAIRAVHAGRVAIDPSLAAEYVQDWVESRQPSATETTRSLTNRERAVLERIALGYTNAEAAEHLGVSVKTVETHRRRIMDKLSVRTRAELVRYAIDHGILLCPRDSDGSRARRRAAS